MINRRDNAVAGQGLQNISGRFDVARNAEKVNRDMQL